MTRRGPSAGFTLIELIVALTLLAMALVVVPSTLKLANRALATSERLSASSDARIEWDFVARHLAEAMPAMARDGDGKLAVAFSGDARNLTFLAPLASGPDGGGVYRVGLSFGAGGPSGGEVLELRLSPRGSAPPGEPAGARDEIRRIAIGTAAGAFRYFGVPAGKAEPEWLDAWTRTDRLPDLVEIAAGTAVLVRAEMRLRLRS